MVSTSKILTVSYGTFSCTLEGFDDSFDTMKAIAEYFRDLASEDRYFGAEPPVPDAEMLARIAEREIARRVEAREERGSIVLRASPYGAVAAPLAPQPAPFAPVQAAAEAPKAPTVAPQTATVAPVAHATEPAQTKAPTVEAEFAAAPDDEADETGADDWEDVALDAFAAEAVPVAPMATPPLRLTPVPHPDPNSVAAKLQRIRDVVTKSAAAPTPETYSEDEHAENFLTETAETFDAALDLEDQTSADDQDDGGDEIAALLSRLAGEDKAEREAAPAVQEPAAADIDLSAFDDTDIEEDAAAESELAGLYTDSDELYEDEVDTAEAAPQPEVPGRVIKIKREDLEAAISKGQLEQVEDDQDEAQAEDAEDDLPAARLDPLQMVPRKDLSPEDEAELRRELAAVEAELVDLYRDTEDHAAPKDAVAAFEDDSDDEDITSLFEDDQDDDQDDEAHADIDAKSPLVLRDPRDQLVKVRAEDDMSRLLAKAENALTEPESASRRNAIAHLRAAVAATKAEQSAGTAPLRDPGYSNFRDDLDNVVRPRRPVGDAATATARPTEQRPAPLKLVAEQRVDLPQTISSAQVRPRRVSLAPIPDDAADKSADVPAKTVSEGGFDEFARKMGATALPDVLEAAAAYLVHVEGRSEFSRPQLMTKARQAAGKALSREDGLRSFGHLLRQGKIQKLSSGRFTASDDIGFKPAARRVG